MSKRNFAIVFKEKSEICPEIMSRRKMSFARHLTISIRRSIIHQKRLQNTRRFQFQKSELNKTY